MHRTHTCGELTKKDDTKEVILSGWLHSRRDHGGLIFIDLRDRYGLTQIVFDPKFPDAHKQAENFRREFVLKIFGTVRPRPEGMKNPNMYTGEIEVLVHKVTILNKAETPPLEVDDRVVANEDMRLKYRYLDLRRPIMQKHLIVKHKAMQGAREFLSQEGFLEIETPLLIRSTPEGARDYVVPSRVQPGKLYSLPQSPQLYKQILMVSGFDKYFQIARCLRDEDLRSDRQPEFTQIDVEMSFVEEKDIYAVGEKLVQHVVKKAINQELQIPFQRLTYQESMEKYGCDKPDLRFGLELITVTDIAKKSDFQVFKNALMIKCINAKKCASFSRKDIDELTTFVATYKAKGLAWAKVENKKLESSITKYFSEEVQKELLEKTHAEDGDLLLFVADIPNIVNASLAQLRNELGKRLKLYDPSELTFCWVVDFPAFEWNEEEGRWDAAHHIFTSPKVEHMEFIEKNPEKVYSQCYDLVLNGVELASGSIRIHEEAVQEKMMKVIGLTKEDAQRKFGFLLEAFRYGAPPHGGFAIGLDRFVAMIQGFNDIREVIAFPKTKGADCPMDGCPTLPDEKTLKELHMRFEVKKG